MFPAYLGHLVAPPEALAFLGNDAADPCGADLTWAYAWPAGERMAGELAAVVQCAGQRIVDLGCGRGHLGLAALHHGAAEVTFCDGSPRPLAWLDAVLTANHLAGRGRSCRHAWGDPIPGGPVPLILGGDILYRPALFPALLATIAASLTVDGEALLSDPSTTTDPALLTASAGAGLRLTHERRAAAGYSLHRLRRV
jgi:predicted nicotinamide N-methyase